LTFGSQQWLLTIALDAQRAATVVIARGLRPEEIWHFVTFAFLMLHLVLLDWLLLSAQWVEDHLSNAFCVKLRG
jgi:hypothetical protein